MVSPDDETYAKFDFYAAHRIEEFIVADPQEQLVRCFGRHSDGNIEAQGSGVLSVTADELTQRIAWPRDPSK